MRYKHILFPVLFILCAMTTQAQDRIKEAGLSFRNFDNFGLNYKIGTSHSLWRFNTVYISSHQTKEVRVPDVNKYRSFGFGVQAGREYRKPIVENVELRYGFDISFTYQHSKQEHANTDFPDFEIITQRKSYQPGVNGVLGFNYVIKNKIIIGAEITPGISYLTSNEKSTNGNSEETEKDLSGTYLNLSSGRVEFILALRL